MTPEEAKLTKKLRAQESVRRPTNPRHCWAVVKKPSTGSGFARNFGLYGNCEHRPRKGMRTCTIHRDREEAAQALGGI